MLVVALGLFQLVGDGVLSSHAARDLTAVKQNHIQTTHNPGSTTFAISIRTHFHVMINFIQYCEKASSHVRLSFNQHNQPVSLQRVANPYCAVPPRRVLREKSPQRPCSSLSSLVRPRGPSHFHEKQRLHIITDTRNLYCDQKKFLSSSSSGRIAFMPEYIIRDEQDAVACLSDIRKRKASKLESLNKAEHDITACLSEIRKRKAEEELPAKDRKDSSTPARQIALKSVYYTETSPKSGKQYPTHAVSRLVQEYCGG